jgi:DNA-nicking Smr family endonuclease
LSNKISDKDKKDWENFLSKNENLPNKDINYINKTKIKAYTFDLHGYSLDEANNKVEQLINSSYENGIKKLIIITGKGIHSENEKNPYVSKNLGILKHSVPEYIKRNSTLMDKISNFTDADVEDGGSGAFYIYLKKKL